MSAKPCRVFHTLAEVHLKQSQAASEVKTLRRWVLSLYFFCFALFLLSSNISCWCLLFAVKQTEKRRRTVSTTKREKNCSRKDNPNSRHEWIAKFAMPENKWPVLRMLELFMKNMLEKNKITTQCNPLAVVRHFRTYSICEHSSCHLW